MLWTKSATMFQYAVYIKVEQRYLTGMHLEHRITVEVYFVADDQLALYKPLRIVLHRTAHVYTSFYVSLHVMTRRVFGVSCSAHVIVNEKKYVDSSSVLVIRCSISNLNISSCLSVSFCCWCTVRKQHSVAYHWY
jgi:hypothetical protein